MESIRKVNLVSFYSQTGSEIMNISNATGVIPKALITNNWERTSEPVRKWILDKHITVFKIPRNPLSYLEIEQFVEDCQPDLITLNGWLRILPESFCNKFRGKIYNGHPGLINYYPDLKGKDPQERAFLHKEKYPRIGTVIHAVIPELDSGEVIEFNDAANNLTSIDDAYNTLKTMSLDCWLGFFAKYV